MEKVKIFIGGSRISELEKEVNDFLQNKQITIKDRLLSHSHNDGSDYKIIITIFYEEKEN